MTVQTLSPQKFADPAWTAKGEPRATVALSRLDTLWFNTGTLCNIACVNCYIESSPRNDRLAYLSLADVLPYLDEIEHDGLGTRLIGFTGGEPFMNRAFPDILEATLSRGYQTLTLTNAMKPMMRRAAVLQDMARRYAGQMRFRVSLDDFRAEVHDAERGPGAFAAAIKGLVWATRTGITVEVAGRTFAGDDEAIMRAGFADLFTGHDIPIDAADPQQLVLFPEMKPEADPPEITTACWGILKKSPDSVMCSSARMVVKRREAERAAVLACTLIPYDTRFDMGATLRDASGPVALAHKYCATFCVLGGAACGAAKDG